MAAPGHQAQFPPPKLSAGYRSVKTFAGTRGNGRDAPLAGVSREAEQARLRASELAR